MLKVENLKTGYENKMVLENVSFECRPGTVTVLIGPNGSGKSTLLKTIAGFLKPVKGTVSFGNQNLEALSERKRAQICAMIAQNAPTGPVSVYDYVLHGRYCKKPWPKQLDSEDFHAVQKALEKFHLEDIAAQRLDKLSGGQRQKAALAKAMAQESPLLLMDEPFTGLDPSSQIELQSFIRQLVKETPLRTVLLVVHDLNQALQLADHIVCLNDRTAVFCGNTNDFLSSGIVQKVFSVELEKITDRNGKEHYLIRKPDLSAGSAKYCNEELYSNS